jgi:hypothetical protein
MKAQQPEALDTSQRTTAMGLLTDSNEMTEAAKIILREDDRLILPIYYLLGHSIELALKSMLLASGVPLTELKNDIGHDLSKAAIRVVALQHKSISNIVQEQLDVISLLNFYYKAKEFEYRITGSKSYPATEVLVSFLDALQKEIRPIALAQL